MGLIHCTNWNRHLPNEDAVIGATTPRARKDGSVSYMARVRVMRDGVTYHETETFNRWPAAAAWMKKRERELAKPGAIAVDPTLAKAIDRYTEESIKDIGRTKTRVAGSGGSAAGSRRRGGRGGCSGHSRFRTAANQEDIAATDPFRIPVIRPVV